MTFYPGTADSALARRLSVRSGRSLTDIDIRLLPVTAAEISGSFVNNRGQTIGGGSVTLEEVGGFGSGGNATIDANGRFVIRNVAPGNYLMRASGKADDMAMMPISIAGKNVDGIRLTAATRSRVAGVVRIVPAASAAFRPTDMVGIVHVEREMQRGDGFATLRSDLTFDARAFPGRSQVRLPPIPAGLALRAVRLRGVDVTDSGFDVRPLEEITGLEIELTSHPTVVSGQVTDTRGTPSRAGTVVVFPRNVERWDRDSRYIKAVRPDQNGQFRIIGLPPGDYHVVSIDGLDPDRATDAELLAQIRSEALSLSLDDGEARTVALQIKAEPVW